MPKSADPSPYSPWRRQPWDETQPWPVGRLPHDPPGGTSRDCHRCGSPRVVLASGARVCVTCGWCCSDSPCLVCSGAERPYRERLAARYR